MRLAKRALLVVAVVLLAVPSLMVQPAAAASPIRPLEASAVRAATSEVVGYLPTWELPRMPAGSLRYDVLTTVALFGVPVRPDGSLDRSSDAYRGVMGDQAGSIIRAAHAGGVRVVVTFTSFGFAANARLLGAGSTRARFVREAVALAAARGADGLDLDLESVPSADLRAYASLVRSTASAMRRADPAARVSVATEANSAGARMAALAIGAGADRAFVMSYAMRTASSSQPGSIDPLDRPASPYSIRAALDQYLAAGVPAGRTVLGLPLYGMVWATSGPGPGASARGLGQVVLDSRIATVVPAGARLSRDPNEATSSWAWYDRAAKTWRQAYVDDAASIAARERFAIGRGLAGVGLWALGYERGQPAYWTAIAAARRSPTVPAGQPAAASGRASSGATTSAKAGGDVTPPSVPAVVVRWDGSRRAWIARWSSRDAGSGIARYRVEYQVGTGPYQILSVGQSTSAVIRASRWARVRVAARAIDAAGVPGAWGWATGRR